MTRRQCCGVFLAGFFWRQNGNCWDIAKGIISELVRLSAADSRRVDITDSKSSAEACPGGVVGLGDSNWSRICDSWSRKLPSGVVERLSRNEQIEDKLLSERLGDIGTTRSEEILSEVKEEKCQSAEGLQVLPEEELLGDEGLSEGSDDDEDSEEENDDSEEEDEVSGEASVKRCRFIEDCAERRMG